MGEGQGQILTHLFDKASEGPDELSKASCVRGRWLESSEVPLLEGGSAGPEASCWVPSFLGFFLGGSCPAWRCFDLSRSATLSALVEEDMLAASIDAARVCKQH